MRANNPFLVLGVDESASRAEIDAAHRKLIITNHPDRFASASVEEQRRAAVRTAEVHEAHLLLTDADYAARNKRKFDRVRAAGIRVEPAPKGDPGSAGEDRLRRPPVDEAATADYRRAAAREFNVSSEREAMPWVAPLRRRRFRRR